MKGFILTADLHPRSMGGKDQQLIRPMSETDLLAPYLEIAGKYNIKVTLFIAGSCIEEEFAIIKRVLSGKQVEIGGHEYRPPAFNAYRKAKNYFGIRPSLAHRMKEISKTKHLLKSLSPTEMSFKCWRMHGYYIDPNIRPALIENNIKYLSNSVRIFKGASYGEDGLIDVPINIYPDHENLLHSGKGRYNVKQWSSIVLKQVEQCALLNVAAVLLIHPICMYIEDKFATFRSICKRLEQFQSCTVSQIML